MDRKLREKERKLEKLKFFFPIVFFFVCGIFYSHAVGTEQLSLGRRAEPAQLLEEAPPPEETYEIIGKLDLNRAEEAELVALPGIGEKLAERILEYRKNNGGFARIEDIKNVKGIGDKTFEKIRESITVDGAGGV